MALIGNFSVLNKSSTRWLTVGGTVAYPNCRSNWNKPGSWRCRSMPDAAGDTTHRNEHFSAKPNGYYPPGAWALPDTAGGLSSHNQAVGTSTATATILDGRALAGTAAGTSTAEATGQLTTSAAGTAAGTSTATASVTAALNATGTAAGTSTASADLVAKGNMAGTAAGSCTPTATLTGIGALAGTSSTASELSPQSLAEAVMTALVETGMSTREALQVILAANGGKVLDAETSTIRFRDTADTKDRITATVDSNGNRTSVTLDTDE